MIKSRNNRYAIGVDIGGSHISSAIIDLASGSICGEPTATSVDSSACARDILNVWVENIRQTATHAQANSIRHVGFAFPGPFDYKRGISRIHGIHKFENIYGLDLSSSLRPLLQEYGIEELRYVNDAAAFALGESFSGAVSNAERVVALTLGTGIGSGFVSQRKLVASGSEVPPNGWVYNLPFEGGIADEAFSTRWVCRRYRELTGKEVSGAREVALQCENDPAARQLFEEYGQRLAEFTRPLLRRFRAEALVLGGNISRAYPLFGPTMQQRLTAGGCHTPIHVSNLLEHAALIGAASLFL